MEVTALSIVEAEVAKRLADVQVTANAVVIATEAHSTAKLRLQDAQTIRDQIVRLTPAQAAGRAPRAASAPLTERAVRGSITAAIRAAAESGRGLDTEELVAANPTLNAASLRSGVGRLERLGELVRHPTTARLFVKGHAAVTAPPASPPAPAAGEPDPAPAAQHPAAE